MIDTMSKYAQIGVQVQITEYDFVEPNAATDWTLANDFSRDLMNACLNSPNCTVFNNWGFSQKYLEHGWGAGYTTKLPYDFSNAITSVFTALQSALLEWF